MKLGILITARLKSTRLPFKLLLDLNGKKVIERVIDRAKSIRGVDAVILCTSVNPQDLQLAKIALDCGIHCYQGSEEDVMQRLLVAAKFHRLDGFISITADNPIFSIYHAEQLAEHARVHFPDYSEVTNVPLGMSTYFLKTKAVDVVCQVKNTNETEFWPVLIKRPEIFSNTQFDGKAPKTSDNWRLTLDTLDDYEVINYLYRNIPFESVLNEFDVLDYLNNDSTILEKNINYQRSWLDKSAIDKIDSYFDDNLTDIITLKNEIYNSV